MLRIFKKKLNYMDKLIFNLPTKSKKNSDKLINNIIQNAVPKAINFDYESIKQDTLQYVRSLKIDDKIYNYKFAQSQVKENLYSSVYALLVFDLYDEVKNLTEIEKKEWIDYLDSFQSEMDGLWYDKNLKNEHYDDSDWWGARHLAIHIVAAYAALGAKPKFNISYVEKFYDLDYLKNWLDETRWNDFIEHSNDIDNKIMNIGVVLQYQRDFLDNEKAKVAMEFLYEYLDSKKNKETQMWGKCDVENPDELSRTIQFSYHLYMLYIYDKKEIKAKNKIVELTLKTQNMLGGFGVKLNSSACEDIDSIELLLYLSEANNDEVDQSIKKAFVWVLANQNKDGGFVFRRNESLWYGHDILLAKQEESMMLATWFRTLSILKIVKFLNIKNDYHYTNVPGY
jgi:prenyltransferase beta subunit